MLAYLVRRLILAVLTIWAVSVLAFVVIQLPPGDYITSYIAQMSASRSFVQPGHFVSCHRARELTLRGIVG
jgi:peptide/nickel transport system permease protein